MVFYARICLRLALMRQLYWVAPNSRTRGGAMGLRLKFNVVLVIVFVLGLGVTGYISYELLHRNARDEVLRSAGVMMEAALSMRSYTVGQITPHLSYRLTQEFLPQSVPAYAATEIMNSLRKKYPDYWYKEATLNPTNPRDRAVGWEADLVSAFRNQPELKELSGVRVTPTGRSLYLTRPLKIRDPACLACHSVPSAAPATLVKRYGDRNGFGWKLNEVVGAQVVSVPMELPIRNANRAFLTFMSSLGVVFVMLFVILNVMMSAMIVRPITRMSRAANHISTGDLEIPEFAETGKDEIALLAKSFNRMRRSLEKAIELIDRK
jgi:HAMP domain-containing protein